MMRIIIVLGIVAAFCCSSKGQMESKQVYQVKTKLPDFVHVNVTNADKFLNDLKLSPMWKVEKEKGGTFTAIARAVEPNNPFDKSGREFLFEMFSRENPEFRKDLIIRNRYISRQDKCSSFSAEMIFQKPDNRELSFASPDGNVTLRIFDLLEDEIGLNSVSQLALKLSDKNDIYLVLVEQGSDKTRTATFQKLISVSQELDRLNKLPIEYRVDEVYKHFFEQVFGIPLKEHDLRRFPGIQDRDTFYGYFRAASGTSYEGINIKISHPVYCPDEGTSKSNRLRKAEYLGKPYQNGDIVFFLIEDNAVYLNNKYNKQFGTFTGSGSFDGTLEVLNGEGITLLKTTDKFKGWER